MGRGHLINYAFCSNNAKAPLVPISAKDRLCDGREFVGDEGALRLEHACSRHRCRNVVAFAMSL
eukprot:scaffold3190_cov409-Prasinococcus_capsulatus_cf.AAC.21